MYCNRKYTPNPKLRGYPKEMHRQALELYIDGMNIRRIARHLGVNHQTIANWIKQYAEKLPQPPVPEEVQAAELDEVFSFIGEKKNASTS